MRLLLRLLPVALVVAPSLTAMGQEEPGRPNIVIILADDLGYGDVGIHGCKDIPTPHIDRLAKRGVLCTQGYASHPFCSPTRAGLLAARYQHRFGYERNIAYDPHNRYMGLPASEVTFAQRLQRSGYVTGALGKWHLGASMPFHPVRRGFSFFYGFLGGGHDYFKVDLLRPQGEGYFSPLERNGKPEGLNGYLTTVLSNEAVKFVEAQHRKPFLLYVAYNAPHTPMQAPEEYVRRFQSIKNKKRRTYVAMVSAMDDGIGSILDALERFKVRENTLVFFFSDNGGPEKANASDNGPLRGQKGDVYEGGIHVPFVASWPKVLPQGKRYDSPVHSIDISRTALAVGGVTPGKRSKLEGVNLIPYLTGKKSDPPHKALFWRKENGAAWAVRTGNYKLLQRRGAEKMELYDLDKDLGESTNLVDRQPDRVQQLKALYEQWNKANQPPFFPSYRDYHRQMDQHYKAITGGKKG